MKIFFYLSIPFITAIIGWITNIIAVKLIFKPRIPLRFGPFVFQGIIPKYQEKFAHALATMSTQELLTARELFQNIEPEKVKEILKSTLDSLAADYVKIALDEVSPTVWNLTPQAIKTSIIDSVKAETYNTVSEIFADLETNIEQRMNLYQFIYDKLMGNNVGLMEDLFYRVSYEQLKFIERVGAYFGFAIGLLQLLIWSIFNQWFILPIVGCFVGGLTNWLAIKMCFEPHQPTKFWYFTYQGMVPRRQKEISKLFGEQAAEEVLRPDYIVENILSGESGDKIVNLISNKVDAVIDDKMGLLKPMGVMLVGERFKNAKEKIVKRAVSSFHEVAEELHYYLKSAIGVSDLLEIRLTSLPKNRFEEILRGLYKEDEVLLIIYGTCIGFTVGTFQAIFFLLI